MKNKQDFINKLIGDMTIEQKVGQCLVIGFVGTVVTPEILRRIRNYYPAGIRAGLTFRVKTALHDPTAVGGTKFSDRILRKPVRTIKDYRPGFSVPHCTNEEYCAFLNTLKKEALDNGLGIPLHITLDMEGDLSADYSRGGIHYFPSAMGLSRSGDIQIVQDVAWATARQVVPLGFNWIHSPVLDVNTNPYNPEIGTRSYSEDFEEVLQCAGAALKGYQKGGLIATGKHFPGRGPSGTDAHDGLPVIDADRKTMNKHLGPYRKLIEAGLPAIMTAHTVYPALDSSGLPATLSKTILTDILKKEMGFQGVITTDAIEMGAILEMLELPQACVEALNAGADLVLLRDEGSIIDEVFAGMVEAVRSNKLSEDRLDDAIARTLSVKYDYGLFENGNLRDESAAGEGINDPAVEIITRQAASRSVCILKDEENILPLSPARRILLIEQMNPLHIMTNSQACHPGILWEQMLRYSTNVGMVETSLQFEESDQQRVMDRIEEAETLVITSYYYRNQKKNDAFVRTLHKLGKPIVVVTNTHYPVIVHPEYKTVITTYGVGPESMEAVAATLFGADLTIRKGLYRSLSQAESGSFETVSGGKQK